MSPTASLLWSLWLLLALTPVTPTPADSAPPPEAPVPVNTTLLFDTGPPGDGLRNCSCSTPVRDCDETLANSLCRCHTVPRSAVARAGLREPGRLTVWLKESRVLLELLNVSTIGHLRLSFCGVKPMDSQKLALLGLQTLRIHSAAAEVPFPNQEITVSPAAGVDVEVQALSLDLTSFTHMTILDTAVLNGLSELKAYTVVGPRAVALTQYFPYLALPLPLPSSVSPRDPADSGEQAAETLQNLLITFIY